MSEIQIVQSMNESILNRITEFKNKKMKKNDLNKYMIINMCFILKTTNKIKEKNKKIKESQDIEIKKSLSKIKSYNGIINFKPTELESNKIMKKLLNPTIELYIPISEISYTTELKFYNKKFDKFNFNEKLLFNKKEKELVENKEKEIFLEEPPIIIYNNKTKNKKLLNEINYIEDNNENNIIDLINENDENIFIKEENEKANQNILFLNDFINSFEEEDNSKDNNKENGNDDLGLIFKKIESSNFLDEINSNLKYNKRNSSGIFYNISSTSGSSSFGSRGGSKEESKIYNNEIYENEFKNFISLSFFNKYSEEMSIDYLRYMLVIYSNAITSANKNFLLEEKMFEKLMKIFILKIGISYKKLYEKISQNFIDNKNICNFEIFLKSFSNILKLKDEHSVLKYKFIMSLFRFGDEEEINAKHINIFLQLIKGKLTFDIDLWEDFNHNLIERYDRIYSYDMGVNFNFMKILLCLETFFDKIYKH